MTLTSGTQLGHYEIESQIGAGGMGEVYKATDTRLDRTVALKVLPPHFADDPDLKQRFEREAKTISSLNHPHICTLFDVGEAEVPSAQRPAPGAEKIQFLVMEYLEGETLAARLIKGPLPTDQVLRYAIEIADALDKAHRKGITHRDLKPGNVMITSSGTKLLDFGLAKLKQPVAGAPGVTAAPTQSANLTMQGAILGTLQYMAPEQLEGNEVDARTDIFAFGVVLFEMATGRKAFEGQTQVSLGGAILHTDPPSVSALQPSIPRALDRVVSRCLAKAPDDRWQTARDLTTELEFVARSGSTTAEMRPTLAAPQGTRWRQAMPIALATLVIGSIITGVAVWSVMRPTSGSLARFVITTPPDAPLMPSGSQPDVAISPDGTRIVYVTSSADGGRQLYVRQLDELTPTPLRGTERGSLPFFSPDGQSVGFRDSEGNVLKKVPALGGTPITVCDLGGVPRGMSWGPDDTIVFATGTSNGLLRVPAVGGEPQVLTTADPEQGDTGHFWPEVLPNGKAVVFTAWSGSDETSRIAVASLDTGDVTYLVQGGSNPHYSPTGHIVYGVGGTLWAVSFDPDSLQVTSTNPVPVVENVNTKAGGAANFSLAADGSLAYVSGAGTGGGGETLVWVDRQGNETPLELDESRDYGTPRLSPDGTRLAVAAGDGENSDVWVSDLALETTTLRLLTTEQGFDGRPLWTQDAERVVFASQREGSIGLFSMAWDGSGDAEPVMVLEGAQSLQPYGWSPGGALLFEYRTSNSQDIGILSPDGDGMWEPLLDTEANELAPAISPDGEWIAYTSDETGGREIYVARFPGLSGEVRISNGGGTYPVWSQDGRELFYNRFRAGGGELTVMPVNLGENLQVATAEPLFVTTPTYSGSPNTRHWDVSPDADRFVMIGAGVTTTDADGQTEIILVQNWFDELERLQPTN